MYMYKMFLMEACLGRCETSRGWVSGSWIAPACGDFTDKCDEPITTVEMHCILGKPREIQLSRPNIGTKNVALSLGEGVFYL